MSARFRRRGAVPGLSYGDARAIAARVRELEEKYATLARTHALSIRLCAEHYGVRDKLRDEVIARERDVALLRSERDEAMAHGEHMAKFSIRHGCANVTQDEQDADEMTAILAAEAFGELVSRIATREGS